MPKVLIYKRARFAKIPDCYYFRLSKLSARVDLRTTEAGPR